jgi:uncharacterized RDD family membrane protein YckC
MRNHPWSINMTVTSETREVQVASLGIRALAAIGDFLLLTLVFGVAGAAFGSAPEQGFGFSFQGTAAVAAYLAGFAYFIVTEAMWGGTPVKRLFGLRVLRADDGLQLGWSESVIRNVLRIVDVLPVLYLVGFIFAVSSPKAQRLGDRIARTVVVRE